MQADRLVIGTVTEALSISYQELWVETPSNNRASNDVVVTVGIRSLGYIEELSTSV